MKTEERVEMMTKAGYKGCGRAWAAVDENNKVVAIKYMSDFVFDDSSLTNWEKCFLSDAEIYRHGNCPSPKRAEIKKIREKVLTAGFPGKKFGADQVRRAAVQKINVLQKIQFGEFREKAKAELQKKGTVMSGQCSCFEFEAKIEDPGGITFKYF